MITHLEIERACRDGATWCWAAIGQIHDHMRRQGVAREDDDWDHHYAYHHAVQVLARAAKVVQAEQDLAGYVRGLGANV